MDPFVKKNTRLFLPTVWPATGAFHAMAARLTLKMEEGTSLIQQLLQERQYQRYVAREGVCTPGCAPAVEHRPFKGIEALHMGH